ncbi:hypothetical protein ASD50_03700 [Mesorhizobium sp. Root552]|nr:hypothetical protein ASD50_03700 [Mesorhizobium sp. Root552]
MLSTEEQRIDITRVAAETLSVFETIASTAETRLREPHATGPHALASYNSFTSGAAAKSLSSIDGARRQNLESLTTEPAIARVVVLPEDGKPLVYYICRHTAESIPGSPHKLAGRNTPAGRLASLDVGDDYELRTPGGLQSVQIVEKALLHAFSNRQGWDSRDSILKTGAYGPVTVISMRDLLDGADLAAEEENLLDAILAEDEKAANILDGIKRNVITKMGLRDQPILDRYQDEIFRLSLDSQLLIVGPPGTGKTTTLIRRLGQKADREYLNEQERVLIDRAVGDSQLSHSDSWLMFTPTELLKQYLKEAFAREGIAAPDQKISTWTKYRHDLARNHFRILRGSTGGGSYVLKDIDPLLPEVLASQTEWFEDFAAWERSDFWDELVTAASAMSRNKSAVAGRLGERAETIVRRTEQSPLSSALVEIVDLSGEAQTMLDTLKTASDSLLRSHLNLAVNRDRQMLHEMAAFLDALGSDDDESEDADSDDEEEGQSPKTRLAVAAATFSRNIRSQARARISGRTLSKNTRAGKIATWIADRTLAQPELRELGESLQLQTALRRFTNPVRRYVNGLPARYRRFRRMRQAEGTWYSSTQASAADAGPLEIDAMLLCSLRTLSGLARERGVVRRIDEPVFGAIKEFLGLTRNQVMVDEATDFSPLQLACMGELSNPRISSFFACGDFNQRITSWGSRSTVDMKWAFPRIEVRPIQVTYRHSEQLSHLASEIVRLCSGESVDVVLPKDVNSAGVDPVLATRLSNHIDIVDWLVARIIEIEKLTTPLPSVAILVNDEEAVGPLADSLKIALSNSNLNVVPCHDGQFVGQENDIRIFDVQHIKGLEFEAVFFIGVDELAQRRPELFDKYLYVGATRAATYLGMTCDGPALPNKIIELADLFKSDWQI